jgi:hypothetical protein
MLIKALVMVMLMLSIASWVSAQQGNKITEDDPRWDCRTMGNKICGPNASKPVYYCGAPTKKGTPCKRRVKQAGMKCWQHSHK